MCFHDEDSPPGVETIRRADSQFLDGKSLRSKLTLDFTAMLTVP